MYNLGDYVVYQKNVYQIKEIKEKYINNLDYYILNSVNDNSLTLNIPTNNKLIRNLISKDELNNIIKNIPLIETLDIDDKNIESEYKKILNNPSHEDLIKIIKTTYLRNKERMDSKRKISDKDKNYFELAEKYLYTEFSIVLDMNIEDTKNYIINEVEKELSHE